jgi:hypothetical protein
VSITKTSTATADSQGGTELRDLEIEAKRLELLERKANLQDMEERLAERELKRDAVKQNAVTHGDVLRQINRDKHAIQERCNHHKGGDGAYAIRTGQGQDPQFAVIKHRFGNNDLWVICLRCGKKWRPPVRKHYKTETEFNEAVQEYRAACIFPTRNQPSTSQQFQWSDGGALYREAISNS